MISEIKVAPGWVYVLTNRGLPGVVKIGMTTRDTFIRTTELLREYGTVFPFAVASRHAVSDCAAVEAAAHRLLDGCRLPRSELFRCDVKAAQKAILSAAVEVLAAPWWCRLWRRQFGWGRLGRRVGRRSPQVPHPYHGSGSYGSRRRGSYDGLLLLALVVALALPLMLLKPALPPWLPPSALRVALLLEHLHR